MSFIFYFISHSTRHYPLILLKHLISGLEFIRLFVTVSTRVYQKAFQELFTIFEYGSRLNLFFIDAINLIGEKFWTRIDTLGYLKLKRSLSIWKVAFIGSAAYCVISIMFVVFVFRSALHKLVLVCTCYNSPLSKLYSTWISTIFIR